MSQTTFNVCTQKSSSVNSNSNTFDTTSSNSLQMQEKIWSPSQSSASLNIRVDRSFALMQLSQELAKKVQEQEQNSGKSYAETHISYTGNRLEAHVEEISNVFDNNSSQSSEILKKFFKGTGKEIDLHEVRQTFSSVYEICSKSYVQIKHIFLEWKAILKNEKKS